MAKITETELQRRLRKATLSGGSKGATASKVGDTWEHRDAVLYLAYADSLTNLDSSSMTIPNQSDAIGFSFTPFNPTGTLRRWRGYLFSKSMYASGDPTDYIWEDVTATSSAVTFVRYYSDDYWLEAYMGDPTNPAPNVTWTLVPTGNAVPSTAFWVAEKYTFNNVESAWVLFRVKSRDVGTPLATYTITGRNKPALSSTQWAADTLVAMSSFTGASYASCKEFGYGTAVVITYDDGKQFGLWKQNSSGVGEWVAPAEFIDGDLLVDGTINADKLMANSIQASHITVTGPNAVVPSTIGAVLPADIAAAVNSNSTKIEGGKITTGSIGAAHITVTGSNAVTPSTISAASQSALDTTNNNVTTAQTTADSKTLPTEVAAAINNNTTTIDGAKITTGSISAGKINTAGLIAENISANLVSSKTLATSKFRISNQNLFENTDKQGKYFPLILVGGLKISSCANGTTYHTGSNVTFYGQDHYSGFHTRGVNASTSGTNITFVINAAGQVDDQISLYYRIYNGSWGSWVCLANVTEPQDSYGTAAVVATYTASMTPSKQIQFATRSTDCNGNKSGGSGHKPCYYGGLVVTASNM